MGLRGRAINCVGEHSVERKPMNEEVALVSTITYHVR